jgi:hypothetical protein
MVRYRKSPTVKHIVRIRTRAVVANLSWDRNSFLSASVKDGYRAISVPVAHAGCTVAAGEASSWRDAAMFIALTVLAGG